MQIHDYVLQGRDLKPRPGRGQRRGPAIDRGEPERHTVRQHAGAMIALKTVSHRFDRLNLASGQAAIARREGGDQ
jgi:hypothetical protein